MWTINYWRNPRAIDREAASLSRQGSAEARLLLESRLQHQYYRFPKKVRRFFVLFERAHPRRLPWRRQGTSAYGMLLAEVLLRQTKAQDAAKTWALLKKKYPDFRTLAKARLTDLRRLLKPLGLQQQRAVALKEIGREVASLHGGVLPSALDQLLSVPHVGLYAASAILCFKFGQQLPIVDSNVLRVLERISGRKLGKDIRRSSLAWSLAWRLLPAGHAVEHNYGLLDFSGLICTPRTPYCGKCPIIKECAYGRHLQSHS